MVNLPRVNVVLATYNGERFLKKQIDSILSQDYANIRLCIRDDGSTDTTRDIIAEYAERYENVSVMDGAENIGVPNSFYEILRAFDDADYYAFADQDDVWEPFKISRAVAMLRDGDNTKPLMYCSSFGYYDEDDSLIRAFDFPEKVDIYNTIYYTPALGFSLVFNDALRKKALFGTDGRASSDCGELHDRRFLRVGAIFGRVICDNEICAKHIRHTDAVTSADSGNMGLLGGFIKNELFGDDVLVQKKGIINFCEDYKDEMSADDAEVLRLFASEKHVLKKLFYPHRLRQRLSGEILLRILFLFRKA